MTVAGPCTQPTPDTGLWAVHVHGPDDMLAMPDREAAEDAAWEINAFQASHDAAHPDTTGFRPVVQAFAEPWPWSEEGHAEELARAAREAEEEDTVRGDADGYRLGVVL